MRKFFRPLALLIALLLSIPLAVGTVMMQSPLRPVFVAHNAFALSFAQAKNGTLPLKIMPLGDSLTAGVTTDDLTGATGGYRVALWNDFKKGGWNNVLFVGSSTSGPDNLPQQRHEGHPGWRTDQIINHVVPWLNQTQPQIILLHIGTNDLLVGAGAGVAASRLNTLLNLISTTSPNALVIVAQIIPVDKAPANGQVASYNQAVVNITHNLAAQGKHVMSVDMFHAVPTSSLVDHIHPNADGYTRMAQVWYKALEPLLAAA